MNIRSISDYRKAVRQGAYAWPGGYPIYFATSDGACLCWQCGAKNERRSVIDAVANKLDYGWRVVATDINYEDDIQCDHCNTRIEAAYVDFAGGGEVP